MTFDEAIEVLANSENNKSVKEGQLEYGLYRAYDVVSVLQKLREEYAPTIEMTKEQYEAFVESVEGLATQKQLDSFVDEELDLGNMTVRRGLNAWLHPETIEIVDE